MSDNFIRHLISIAGTIIVGLAWVAGYFSSANGWWWTAFSIIIVYVVIYKNINV